MCVVGVPASQSCLPERLRRRIGEAGVVAAVSRSGGFGVVLYLRGRTREECQLRRDTRRATDTRV